MKPRLARLLRAAGFLVAVLGAAVTWLLWPPQQHEIEFPDGKQFAFTIVDDTDMATLERNAPVYDTLHRYGLKTTKTVWVLAPTETDHPSNAGDSLQDADYVQFVRDLRDKGFEIAIHGVRGGSSPRADTIAGLEAFRREFGDYPRLHVNHSRNRENLYWGAQRWSLAPLRWIYRFAKDDRFSGEDPASPYYWGDLARRHVRYVNQFTFGDINLLNVTPSFPYHLPDKPLVNRWFPTANGDNLDQFERLLSPDNLDRLEREGGVCIVYTHLGAGSFNTGSGVNPRFEDRIRDVASRNGWFVPASELLDYLEAQPGWRADPGWRERVRLEILFLWEVITG
ncbi:MAG TPA: hypothetical protein VFR29_10835 [Steroidobacteraceae bacterium]|nr:hypothetical protein [Steroidobacteraceae bacterium]